MHHIRRLISVITFLGAIPLLVIASAAADRQQPQFTQQTAPAVSESPAAGTSAPVFEDQQLDGILGKAVRSSADEDMGRIVDVLVSREGQLRAVVIDFGGFLGVGSRKVAVDWNALHFPAAGKLDRVTLELTRDQVRLAPEYRPGEPVKVVSAPSQLLPNASPLTEK
jgi:PRC-barrel domain